MSIRPSIFMPQGPRIPGDILNSATLNTNNAEFINKCIVPYPSSNNEAANKLYVDTHSSSSGTPNTVAVFDSNGNLASSVDLTVNTLNSNNDVTISSGTLNIQSTKRSGSVTLTNGQANVPNVHFDTGDGIFISPVVNLHPGFYAFEVAQGPGDVSFTIFSTSSTDSSTLIWMIVKGNFPNYQGPG